jgi:hypothetical protein
MMDLFSDIRHKSIQDVNPSEAQPQLFFFEYYAFISGSPARLHSQGVSDFCRKTYMHKRFSVLLVYSLLFLTVFDACSSFRGKKNPPVLTPPEFIPKPAEEPIPIMGAGQMTSEALSAFLLKHNPALGKPFTDAFAVYYVDEAHTEGVNADVAFAQMCVETGFLSFRGQVTPDMNNFAGLGTTGPGVNGEHFPSPQIGVRAQIQHLKAYATIEPLNGELVDPRYKWVKYGSAPTVAGLSGKWAADKNYGRKIQSMLERLYSFSEAGDFNMPVSLSYRP